MSTPTTTTRKPPTLTLSLRQGVSAGADILQLHQPSLSALNNLEITTFSSTRPILLSCRGLTSTERRRLDVLAALRAGLLELSEESTNTVVDFPRDEPVPAGQHLVPPKPSPRSAQAAAGLVLDSTAPVWREKLRAGAAYVLRFAADADDDKAWCEYVVNDDDDDDDANDEAAGRVLPVALDRDSAVRFAVYDDPTPPVFECIFGVEPGVAHLSGEPPFKFVAELTYKAPPAAGAEAPPVTFCTERTPFGAMLPVGGGLSSVEQLVYCVDEETGEEPEWPWAFQCFDSDPWGEFPDDDQFVEIAPGATWRFEYTLGGPNEGLETLEKGSRYRVELSKGAKSGFRRWMFGKREELLKGTVEEKVQRWKPGPRGRPSIPVEQVNEPVLFDVVD
ncbi:uncharacterized protein BKCO1_2500092 [Diplodia corticola]|uniref:Uncharacterized protein n=1 Tax=Diplodia corticola TaxID=236234 RepID=A0A1J9S273_9PEZI|nr:uncharacterized protein BKCO1_2500092 [Diplodia corticola]OJD34108.1 hypothetical protein BKCO1_2500092 [Diplodia corticola]